MDDGPVTAVPQWPTRATGQAPLDTQNAESLAALILDGNDKFDLYEAYRNLRAIAPVFRTRSGALVLSRYEDCATALRSKELGKAKSALESRFGKGLRDEISRKALIWLRRSMMYANPPEHARLRRLVSSSFIAHRVEEFRGTINADLDVLLDRLGARSSADFITVVAEPLAASVIARLIGIPEAERNRFAGHVGAIAALHEPHVSDEALARGVAAQAELTVLIRRLLTIRRRQPAPDILTQLAVGDATEEEIIATVILLFGAGYETTAGLLGNGLRALLEHPGQLALLRGQPALMRSAIEEMLRFDSPVQVNGRIGLEPVTIAGVAVPAGQLVISLLGAANHDPDRFTRPDQFDITRDEGPHLAFADGIHLCLGAHLARLEGHLVFSRLLARFGAIELAGEPELGPGHRSRKLTRLPITT
jgi:cytochrome P450